MVTTGNFSHKHMPRRSVRDVSLTYHAEMVRTWNYSCNTCMLKYRLQELLPWTHTQHTLYGIFSHTNRSHRDLPQQTYAQYTILYRMFVLHILAEIVPTRISSHKPMPSTFSKGCFPCMFRLKWWLCKTHTNSCPRRAVSFAHPGWNHAYRGLTTPINPCSVCSTGCFSYTSRLR